MEAVTTGNRQPAIGNERGPTLAALREGSAQFRHVMLRLVSTLLVGALPIAAHVVAAADAPRTPAPTHQDNSTIVYGDGWATVVSAPQGWEFDCCKRATVRNVNLLVYPHGWNGETTDRVMTLTVWSNGRPTLAADWDADARDYAAHFPGAVAQAFPIAVPERRCRSAVYTTQDNVRDYVVFCDAGNGLGFRYGWSMTLEGEHADRAQLESDFCAVVAQTVPMNATIERRAE